MTLTSRPIPRTMKAINVGIGAATVLIVRPIPIHIGYVPGHNSARLRLPVGLMTAGDQLGCRIRRAGATRIFVPRILESDH